MVSKDCIRVALLDGEPIFFDCLKLLFDQTNFVIVRSFDETLNEFEQIRTLRPKLVLSDPRPVSDAVQLKARLEAARMDVPIVFIRLDPANCDAVRLTENSCGAGFVSKSAVSATLLKALEIVSMGGVFVDPVLKVAAEELSRVENVIQFERGGAGDALPPSLSAREREVLFSVALGNSSKEIAAKMGLSCKTIDTYKTRAMQKLELPDRSSVVRFALLNDWFADLAAELKRTEAGKSGSGTSTHLKVV